MEFRIPWFNLVIDIRKEKKHKYVKHVCGENDWWCHGTCFRHKQCMYVAPGSFKFDTKKNK